MNDYFIPEKEYIDQVDFLTTEVRRLTKENKELKRILDDLSYELNMIKSNSKDSSRFITDWG